MRFRKRTKSRAFVLLPLLVAAVAVTLMAASCGSGTGSSQATGTSTKLPPGATGETLTDTSSDAEVTQTQATAEEEEESTATDSTTTNSNTTTSTELVKTVYLSGANIAVVAAARDDSNDAALTSSTREVSGDFLQLEMTVTNVDDELVDLSKYSFRLWNPAIDADQYEDFYGTMGPTGDTCRRMSSPAILLDYYDPAAVGLLKLRMGETVDNVFLFFDLNPQNTARNEGVTKEGTNLIIYDTGRGRGDEVEINLSGYSGLVKERALEMRSVKRGFRSFRRHPAAQPDGGAAALRLPDLLPFHAGGEAGRGQPGREGQGERRQLWRGPGQLRLSDGGVRGRSATRSEARTAGEARSL